MYVSFCAVYLLVSLLRYIWWNEVVKEERKGGEERRFSQNDIPFSKYIYFRTQSWEVSVPGLIDLGEKLCSRLCAQCHLEYIISSVSLSRMWGRWPSHFRTNGSLSSLLNIQP